MVNTGEVPDNDAIVLNETIHQPTRLRIMSLLVSVDATDPLAYGFLQNHLELTPGNLTTHLRKLEDAEYVAITKEFHGVKPRTWVQATAVGRHAFAEYVTNLERALGVGGRS
ncbi:transcriptional regulator [Candidatus Poriferisodalis sp.]|uniref:transcriptional regulator n=1 Tax=Candidatus Poriferisodalis sp. TaxID=3101277 RepID=UPI003B5B0C7B